MQGNKTHTATHRDIKARANVEWHPPLLLLVTIPQM
jgi:hypothetical protein